MRIIILLIAILGVIVASVVFQPKQVRYDCSIAEISPDIPIEVKSACRKKVREGL